MFKKIKKKVKDYLSNKNRLFYHFDLIISLGLAALINWELAIVFLIFNMSMTFKIVSLIEMSFDQAFEKIPFNNNDAVEGKEAKNE